MTFRRRILAGLLLCSSLLGSADAWSRALRRPPTMTLEGLVVNTAGDVACAFAGGTVGVMGSLVAIEIRKLQQRKRNACPYCVGTGRLTCAVCWGAGKVEIAGAQGSQTVVVDCPNCAGKGQTTCVNCKGDGRLVPLMLDRRASRDPEDELEEIGLA
uniref:CR-type domain-containing protein n=1 Tax=Pinguiococcus pyrenoidosus TaxID=172671 RepID=A0A7R9U8V3_9STRA|mmetsp:Transcript_17184/g.65589  ORF Transcript_17184/g.65589 Transcript_17184/m.65589 type:complete len:157 (+) Transcript_17184:153-623(+)